MKCSWKPIIILTFLITLISFVITKSYINEFHNDIKEYIKNSEKDDNLVTVLEGLMKDEENMRFLSEDASNSNCKDRPHAHYSEPFGFYPLLVGKLKKVGDIVLSENECFKSIKIELVEFNSNIKLRISPSQKKSFFCKHSYLFATTNKFDFKVLFSTDFIEVNFENLSVDDIDEIKVNGIKVFEFCHGFLNTIFDILKTKKMFEGQEYPRARLLFESEMEFLTERTADINREFLEEYGFVFNLRANNTYTNINKTLIRSGDLLTGFDFDAGHSLIMWGTGARTGHAAMTLWIDNELYDTIRKVKWDDWMKHKEQTHQHITYHPIREDLLKKFDSNAAYEFFKTMDNGPYGMRNFVFSWFDTSEGNLPHDIPTEFLGLFVSILGKFKFDLMRRLVGEGLQNRLNIIDRDMTIPQITAEAARRNLTLEDLFSLPEKEEYIYSNGPQWICSALVVKMWMVGGMFDNIDLKPQEFTPKDIYELNIFEKDLSKIPQVCLDENHTLPYCMVLGAYQMIFPGYNTLELYDNMNEKCPSSAPFYERPDRC